MKKAFTFIIIGVSLVVVVFILWKDQSKRQIPVFIKNDLVDYVTEFAENRSVKSKEACIELRITFESDTLILTCNKVLNFQYFIYYANKPSVIYRLNNDLFFVYVKGLNYKVSDEEFLMALSESFPFSYPVYIKNQTKLKSDSAAIINEIVPSTSRYSRWRSIWLNGKLIKEEELK